MPDIRDVAEKARGKRTWSVDEVRAAFPSMSKEIIDRRLREKYSGASRVVSGIAGWHGGGDMKATHFFVRGWALCGWGTISVDFGRGDDILECPTCRNEVERSKVA